LSFTDIHNAVSKLTLLKPKKKKNPHFLVSNSANIRKNKKKSQQQHRESTLEVKEKKLFVK
jgi:hypothetical protein